MSEDLNLPASLQRLEITPERLESSKFEENNPFSLLGLSETQTDCGLESLSLKAECSKGNCHCNRKKESKDEDVLRKLKRTQRRPVLRRSRLSSSLLRAPVLKLTEDMKLPSSSRLSASSGDPSTSTNDAISPNDSLSFISGITPGEDCENDLVGRNLLRAPVLRVSHSRTPLVRCSSEENPTVRAVAMCAVQARNPTPDDTNIEELASYFDLFVHIPKKMSVMAEMMYI